MAWSLHGLSLRGCFGIGGGSSALAASQNKTAFAPTVQPTSPACNVQGSSIQQAVFILCKSKTVYFCLQNQCIGWEEWHQQEKLEQLPTTHSPISPSIFFSPIKLILNEWKMLHALRSWNLWCQLKPALLLPAAALAAGTSALKPLKWLWCRQGSLQRKPVILYIFNV